MKIVIKILTVLINWNNDQIIIDLQLISRYNQKMNDIVKYPSTIHLEGSALQNNDSTDVVSFDFLKNKFIVIEAKIDGANCGLSFSSDGELLMQSRGHYLLGHDKKHFDLFKRFCRNWEDELFDQLGDQYIMYGEWMYALHSIYYDKLPHYFMEFDIYDKFNYKFLSTEKRREITKSFKNVRVESVPVLTSGNFSDPRSMLDLIGPSIYISDNAIDDLKIEMDKKRYPENVKESLLKLNEGKIDEGLYVKLETEEETIGRFKFVRSDFTQTIIDNDLHWNDRPIISNKVLDI